MNRSFFSQSVVLLVEFLCYLQSSNQSVVRDSTNSLLRTPKIFEFFRAWNFFPLPFDTYCNSTDQRRLGICMNPYECRLQGGKADGSCASGFGVCCLFVSSCNQETSNNITYFINPNFPDVYVNRKMTSCTFKIKKIDEDVRQIRLDFIHFNMAQPNKLTGLCNEDSFEITNDQGESILNICGSNNDQHVYIDMNSSLTAINLTINLKKQEIPQIWEIRVIFLTEEEMAPKHCLQFHTGASGVLKSFNFFVNGRLLANQEYNICIRQENRMCSIVYQLCDENSFAIGESYKNTNFENEDAANSVGNITLDFPISLYSSTTITKTTRSTTVTAAVIATTTTTTTTTNGLLSTTDYITKPTNFENEDLDSDIWQNYTIYQKNNGIENKQISEDLCVNKILMPCQTYVFKQNAEITNEDLCSVSECGRSFCPFGLKRCRLESNNLPFLVRVKFGLANDGEQVSPNTGVCLKYEQQLCTN